MSTWQDEVANTQQKYNQQPHKHLTEVVEGIYKLHNSGKSVFGSPFIESIKEIRMITGWGLLESKMFVETLIPNPHLKPTGEDVSLKKSTKWVTQYRVQSSNGKKEYVVSKCEDGHYECSCPNWTRNMPREDCKHILSKKLELLREKLELPQVTVGLSITQVSGRKFR